ncbi:hypothetical protein THASP1DRAFT_25137, partial [Thamnocephalis sphaerospora]
MTSALASRSGSNDRLAVAPGADEDTSSNTSRRIFRFIPVSDGVTKVNLIAFLLGSMFAICFAVFLNAAQAFVLSDIIGIGEGKGEISGSLSLYDEIVSIIAAAFWEYNKQGNKRHDGVERTHDDERAAHPPGVEEGAAQLARYHNAHTADQAVHACNAAANFYRHVVTTSQAQTGNNHANLAQTDQAHPQIVDTSSRAAAQTKGKAADQAKDATDHDSDAASEAIRQPAKKWCTKQSAHLCHARKRTGSGECGPFVIM